MITLHLRLSSLTQGIIGAREIALMKPNAVLINTARAAVTDEKALVAALQERRIAGAGLDVYMEEPLPPDSPLVALDNVVLTPHVGYTSTSVQELQAEWAVDNVESYLAGRTPEMVNPEVWAERRT